MLRPQPRSTRTDTLFPSRTLVRSVIALGGPGVRAVGGEEELGQVVGADRQEIEMWQKQVERLGQSRHLEHRAIADRGRQLLAAAGEPGALDRKSTRLNSSH